MAHNVLSFTNVPEQEDEYEFLPGFGEPGAAIPKVSQVFRDPEAQARGNKATSGEPVIGPPPPDWLAESFQGLDNSLKRIDDLEKIYGEQLKQKVWNKPDGTSYTSNDIAIFQRDTQAKLDGLKERRNNISEEQKKIQEDYQDNPYDFHFDSPTEIEIMDERQQKIYGQMPKDFMPAQQRVQQFKFHREGFQNSLYQKMGFNPYTINFGQELERRMKVELPKAYAGAFGSMAPLKDKDSQKHWLAVAKDVRGKVERRLKFEISQGKSNTTNQMSMYDHRTRETEATAKKVAAVKRREELERRYQITEERAQRTETRAEKGEARAERREERGVERYGVPNETQARTKLLEISKALAKMDEEGIALGAARAQLADPSSNKKEKEAAQKQIDDAEKKKTTIRKPLEDAKKYYEGFIGKEKTTKTTKKPVSHRIEPSTGRKQIKYDDGSVEYVQ